MTWVVAGLAALVAAVAVLYNRLVRDRNRVAGAWSDIDVQLQRRHDLIPQLVKAVDQYARYERATIAAVTALRAEAMRLQDVDALGRAEEELSSGVHKLLALAEQYPELKADRNFLALQEELVETEDHLQFARRYYNGAVREYNTRLESVPSNFVARSFGFEPRQFFQKEADEVAAVPRVDLGNSR
ncbi:MAG TPA: LemA family protein [Woeseiaceae bacterium]|nr:LemA family protein [Woeseiaceae bacterium]